VRDSGCNSPGLLGIPPKANSAFVAAMEDVLAVYTRPHDPDRPLVCLDETSKQLIAETKSPPGSTTAMPSTPGQTGASPPRTHALNSTIYTLQYE
jgi:hypothetical protein